MICVYCKSDIEEDSFYCDQCGKELFICSTCKQPRRGKRCSEDGGVLFSPRLNSLTISPNESNQVINNAIKSKTDTSPSRTSVLDAYNFKKFDLPNTILKLINTNLNIDLEIKDNSIIGRTEGEFAKLFSKFSEISGKHLVFNYDETIGWTVRDTGFGGLGSTNGTKVSTRTQWDSVARLEPNKPATLKDNSYILIANKYEFLVKIISQQSSTPTGTLRI